MSSAKTSESRLTPLPQRHRIALSEYIVGKDGREYQLFWGIEDSHIDFLVHAAHFDPLITAQTHDSERFSSREAVLRWLNEERLIYSLSPAHQKTPVPPNPENLKQINQPHSSTHSEKPQTELAGIAWFSRKSLPPTQAHWTFAIRLYENARGNSLSSPFMKRCFAEFWKQHPGETVWLVTKKTNTLAQKLYEKCGFQKTKETSDSIFYLIHPV